MKFDKHGNGNGIDDLYVLPEAEANARLISAAPDMYEALKMVIASVPFAAYRGDGELEEVERVVLVALNKAEGRG